MRSIQPPARLRIAPTATVAASVSERQSAAPARVAASVSEGCRRNRTRRAAAGWFTLAVLLIAVPAAFAVAAVEGRVALPLTRFAPVENQRYEIVSKAGVLATNPPLAVVYLEGDFPPDAKPGVAQVAQKNLMFVPSLLPIRVGTRVAFPNLDSTYHNIFSFSPAKRFDLGRYRSDERPIPSVRFDTPGLVTLRCDIHEHMRGLILVLATPYFVVTHPDGTFRLHGLPAGRYVLKAWVNSQTTRERPIVLEDGATAHVDFP